MSRHLCPVCGFSLDFAPWRDLSPSDEICPCCGIQFGYTDAAGGDLAKRREIYLAWRRKWILEFGMRWRSNGRKPPPQWDPNAQLAELQKREML